MSKRNKDTKDLHLSRSCQKDQTVTCSSKVKDVQFGANFQTLKEKGGNPLVIQWLGLSTFTAKSADSITGQGTKTLQALLRGQKQKLKKERKKEMGEQVSKTGNTHFHSQTLEN